MTPFGRKLRQIRAERGIRLKEMAEALGVSSAYLSALEHGQRGKPSRRFVTEVCLYLNIIWDDAEAIHRLAGLSDPRVTVDTRGLSPEATLLANELAERIGGLSATKLREMRKILAPKHRP